MEKLEKVAARGCDKKLKPEYVSQCLSMSTASPAQHASTQIITLPHTANGKNVFFWVSLCHIFLSFSEIESDRGSGVFCCRNH
jgi:hypothetical protein